MTSRSESNPPREKFPETHAVEELRGEKRLPASRVRKALVNRCGWLQDRIRERRAMGAPFHMHTEELRALVQAAEAFDVVTGRET